MPAILPAAKPMSTSSGPPAASARRALRTMRSSMIELLSDQVVTLCRDCIRPATEGDEMALLLGCRGWGGKLLSKASLAKGAGIWQRPAGWYRAYPWSQRLYGALVARRPCKQIPGR